MFGIIARIPYFLGTVTGSEQGILSPVPTYNNFLR
jgi:hypothetical protein